MNEATERRNRLESLLQLARVARGWSGARLARSLGRDPTKILPESGNPKMDYIVALAEVLEWPVGDVVEAIWSGGRANGTGGEPTDAGFRELNEVLMTAVREADHTRVVEIARQMYTVARTPDERAHACIREAAGWDGLGRYPKVLDVVQRGLQQGPLSLRLRLSLQATLANAQYTLWDLTPALGTCEVLARWYEQNPPEKRHDWKRVAYVHYVRGNTHRRLIALEPDTKLAHCNAAKSDLERAAELYTTLADELEDPNLLGFANTCEGGLIETAVELGHLSADDAIARYMEGLDRIVDLDNGLSGDWIESYGWWCIFGSNVALRHLKGRDLQRSMAVFTNKALEIADRLNNWAMRERVFTMQYALHQAITTAAGIDLEFTIDEEDRSLITATMGRFPSFRDVGWQILDTARVVRAS